MHIAIEGIDGVGKSTASKTVAESFGFKFVEKPLHYIFDKDDSIENYLRIRDYFNEQPDRFLSAWFYGLGNLYLVEKFKGQDIVTDRHIVSNYCWSVSDDNIEIYDLLVKRLGVPDHTFILYGDEKTVAARIRGRDREDPDINKTCFIPEAYKRMTECCERYRMPYTVIDTTTYNSEEVAECIIEIVKRIER